MMREPMNMVPLSPIIMVRPPGWPDDQTSALKPAGSLSLSSGILSTGVAIGETGCGFRFWSCLLVPTLVLSIWLKPGGKAGPGTAEGVAVGGAGGAGCWAETWPAAIASTKPAAAGKASRYAVESGI